jgi:hypothetical protein
MQKSKPVDAVDVLHGILMSGGVVTVPEAEQVAEIINQWKCGSCAVIFYSKPFRMSADEFFRSVKPMGEAILHDVLRTGRQIFLINTIGDWEAYPNYELKAPKGYWWMNLARIRGTLKVKTLTPAIRIPTSIEKRLTTK